jgi:hypothetical protein
MISVGYAEIGPDTLNTTPSGVAIFGLRLGGVLISEAGVPESAPILTGRIYAEVNASLNTGLTIANPNSQEAVITYYFSDETRIAAGGHIAAFLNEEPFNAESPFSGTFTFSSDVPVAVVTLRGLTNDRSEFLMTTLPVSPLAAGTDAIVYFPYFADGEGWISEAILVNPIDSAMTGTVEFLGQGSSIGDAQPVNVTINDQTQATFNYSIPGRSSRRLQTAGTNATVQVGSVRPRPDEGRMTPSGLSVISFKVGPTTAVEAGVSSAARIFRSSGGTPQTFRTPDVGPGKFVSPVGQDLAVTGSEIQIGVDDGERALFIHHRKQAGRDDVYSSETQGLGMFEAANKLFSSVSRGPPPAKFILLIKEQVSGRIVILYSQCGQRPIVSVKLDHALQVDGAENIYVMEDERIIESVRVVEKKPGGFFKAPASIEQNVLARQLDAHAKILIRFEIFGNHFGEVMNVDNHLVDSALPQAFQRELEQRAARHLNHCLGPGLG